MCPIASSSEIGLRQNMRMRWMRGSKRCVYSGCHLCHLLITNLYVHFGRKAGGFETPADGGTLTNFVEMGQARDKILSLKLDQVSNTSTPSGLATSVDPKGYLTSLDSVVIKSDAEIGDIKRARMLFDSLVKSNPKHAPGWIAAACLEEHAGRMVAARKLIKAGCEQCPKSEDVWLEAARLHVCRFNLYLLYRVCLIMSIEQRRCQGHFGKCRAACRTECQNLARCCRLGARRQGQEASYAKRY